MAKQRTLTEKNPSTNIVTKIYPVTTADIVYVHETKNVKQALSDIDEDIDEVNAKIDDYKTESENTFVPKTSIGKLIAPLNEDRLIPSKYLPSYVDDVLDYDDRTEFPEPGETGKIYVDNKNNTTYRWTGSQYVVVGGKAIGGIEISKFNYSLLSEEEKYNDTVYYIYDEVPTSTGVTVLTQAEYDALTDEQKISGRIFAISDGESGASKADIITYTDNYSMGATSVQLAIDRLARRTSYVGDVIQSTTLDTEEKVKNIYGGTSWAPLTCSTTYKTSANDDVTVYIWERKE